MALPPSIEIVPLETPVAAQITVPGSKSITNRALILAALADGETTLQSALWSEDTEVMVDCLREIGFMVDMQPDPRDACNRQITVYGRGGTIPPGGTKEQPLDLFVGNAGTAARFLAAFLCLGKGVYRLHGVDRMHARPQAALFAALRQLQYAIDSANDRLPALICGSGPRPGRCQVSITESSQFASALLLCANRGQWSVEVTDDNADESPYVTMTSKLIEVFPRRGGSFQIEPDASSGSYFLAASTLMSKKSTSGTSNAGTQSPSPHQEGLISVAHWPSSRWQIDERFPEVIARVMDQDSPQGTKEVVVSRQTDLGDSIMTAIVLAPLAPRTTRFVDLGRLRLQECERVMALRTELTKCGARVAESGDTLEIFPSALHSAVIDTYNDHRMAMCFAILGLKVPGIILKNPSCVKKTFPNFFQKLAAPTPVGLGAIIRDVTTGGSLMSQDLFAD